MARWIQMAEFGRMSSSYSSSAAGFLAVLVCVLAAATMAAALCAKEIKSRYKIGRRGGCLEAQPGCLGDWKLPDESKRRALINSLSNKALLLSKKWRRSDKDVESEGYDTADTEDGDILWQKKILMGMRCQPLNFSGPLRSPKDNNIFLLSTAEEEKGGNR